MDLRLKCFGSRREDDFLVEHRCLEPVLEDLRGFPIEKNLELDLGFETLNQCNGSRFVSPLQSIILCLFHQS